MFTWLGTAALLPDSLLSNHPHRIGIYRRAVHAPVNHINPHQNERNTQQLSHIQQHTLLESLLIQLDELDEKTSQENPDQPHAEHHARTTPAQVAPIIEPAKDSENHQVA